MVRQAALEGQLSDFLGSAGVVVFYLLIWALVFAGTAGAFVAESGGQDGDVFRRAA